MSNEETEQPLDPTNDPRFIELRHLETTEFDGFTVLTGRYHSTWREREAGDGDEPFIEVRPTPRALPPEEPAPGYSAWLNEVLNRRGSGKQYYGAKKTGRW
jgi:hypothetical protein